MHPDSPSLSLLRGLTLCLLLTLSTSLGLITPTPPFTPSSSVPNSMSTVPTYSTNICFYPSGEYFYAHAETNTNKLFTLNDDGSKVGGGLISGGTFNLVQISCRSSTIGVYALGMGGFNLDISVTFDSSFNMATSLQVTHNDVFYSGLTSRCFYTNPLSTYHWIGSGIMTISSNTGSYVFKVDFALTAGRLIAQTPHNAVFNDKHQWIDNWKNGVLVGCGFYPPIFSLDSATMNYITIYNTPLLQLSLGVLIDNLNTNNLFHSNSGMTQPLRVFDLSVSTASNLVQPFPMITSFAFGVYGGMYNLGRYQLLIYTIFNTNSLYYIDKSTFTLKGSIPLHTPPGARTLTQPWFRDSKKFNFSYMQFNTNANSCPACYNMHIYSAIVDLCLSRNGANVCSSCPVNTYLDSSIAPFNNCFYKSEFPVSKGVSPSTGIISPCSDARCTNCIDNSNICIQCPANTYLDSTSALNHCLLTSEFPPKTGVNPVTFLVTACSDPNCNDCKMNNLQCAVCTPPYFLLAQSCVNQFITSSEYIYPEQKVIITLSSPWVSLPALTDLSLKMEYGSLTPFNSFNLLSIMIDPISSNKLIMQFSLTEPLWNGIITTTFQSSLSYLGFTKTQNVTNLNNRAQFRLRFISTTLII